MSRVREHEVSANDLIMWQKMTCLSFEITKILWYSGTGSHFLHRVLNQNVICLIGGCKNILYIIADAMHYSWGVCCPSQLIWAYDLSHTRPFLRFKIFTDYVHDYFVSLSLYVPSDSVLGVNKCCSSYPLSFMMIIPILDTVTTGSIHQTLERHCT